MDLDPPLLLEPLDLRLDEPERFTERDPPLLLLDERLTLLDLLFDLDELPRFTDLELLFEDERFTLLVFLFEDDLLTDLLLLFDDDLLTELERLLRFELERFTDLLLLLEVPLFTDDPPRLLLPPERFTPDPLRFPLLPERLTPDEPPLRLLPDRLTPEPLRFELLLVCTEELLRLELLERLLIADRDPDDLVDLNDLASEDVPRFEIAFLLERLLAVNPLLRTFLLFRPVSRTPKPLLLL